MPALGERCSRCCSSGEETYPDGELGPCVGCQPYPAAREALDRLEVVLTERDKLRDQMRKIRDVVEGST
jgi:hypothetical protein